MESARPDKVERAKKILETHHKASQAVKARLAVQEGETITFDEETIKELEALGYIIE